MYHKNSSGDIDYSHEYSPVNTDASGGFFVAVEGNPFDPFSWNYWEFLIWGWNRVAIKMEMCNGQTLCMSDIEYIDNHAYVELTYPARITQRIRVKDSITKNPIAGALVTYIDGFNDYTAKLTDVGGLAEWTDAHPLLITIFVTGTNDAFPYTGRAISIDRRGNDMLNACWWETEELMDPIITSAFVHFDKRNYHPEETINLSFDTLGTTNCKIRLYDRSSNLLLEVPLGMQTQSPPVVKYLIPLSVAYGYWTAKLVDSSSNEMANDFAFVGTKGILSYDISKLCTDKKLNIGFSGIDPVFKPGAQPNNMKIQLYDGANHLLGTYNVLTASGAATYTLSGTESMSDKWTAKLIDQWNNVVYIERISVFSCIQTILGRVSRVNGNPVKSCKVTIDLTFMGFGVFQVTTDATGGFKFTGLPPFPTTDIKFYKSGYLKKVGQVSLSEDELKSLNTKIEGLIKGAVTDEENKPVGNAYVILEGGGDLMEVVETTRDDGNYDLPPKATGYQTLRFMKNNFNVSEEDMTIADISENALQTVKNMQLVRRALDLFDANFKRTNVAYETSLVQLDQIDIQNIQAGMMELTNSGQKIALIQAIAGAGQSQNVGIPGLLYETGDVTCEYYGDDENGKPIIRCSYTNRLEI